MITFILILIKIFKNNSNKEVNKKTFLNSISCKNNYKKKHEIYENTL